MTSNTSYHFAVALLRLARKTGELAKIERDLGKMVEMMAAQRRVMYFLLHPLVPMARKEDFLREVTETRIVPQLIKVLMGTKNLSLIGEIYSQFSTLAENEVGMVKAEIRVAVGLSAGDQTKLREALERLTGKRVELEVTADPDLLAGVWVKIGDRVIDNTVKTELKMVRERLVT